MRIRVAVSCGPETPFTVEDAELSAPRPDEVLVRLEAVGICGSDLYFKRKLPVGTPAVLGHEGAGIVESVGSAVTGVDVGDRVVLSYRSCGTCAQCVGGRRPYCAQFAALNTRGRRPDGSASIRIGQTDAWSSFFGQSSFASHALATPGNLVVVPPDTDPVIAAPMGCGFLTGAGAVINGLRLVSGSSAVVFGVGGVGSTAIMTAAVLGADPVIAVDLSKQRLALATEIGATHALDGASEDLVSQIRDLTGGGATHALDTTGDAAVIRTAALALGRLGELVLVGLGTQGGFDLNDLITLGKNVRGCMGGDSTARELLPILLGWHARGLFPAERVISAFRFEDVNTAVARMREDVVKPVLTF
jgi:aryl-alcohol dehydrogenase